MVVKRLLVLLAAWMAFCPFASSQDRNQKLGSYASAWVENLSVEIPQGLEICYQRTDEGVTRYWFEIEDIKIYISPTNVEHYLNGTAIILLVEWYNVNTDTYKYTTRKKKELKQSRLSIMENEE